MGSKMEAVTEGETGDLMWSESEIGFELVVAMGEIGLDESKKCVPRNQGSGRYEEAWG